MRASSPISDALFNDTRRAVLALLYGNPGASWYLRQIVRLVGGGQGAVHRELSNLAAAGIVTRTRGGREVYYQADPSCPVFEELRGIVRKTSGLADVLRSALEPLAPSIRTAFVYGSVAAGSETPASDIDLMVVGDVGFDEVVRALAPAQKALGREINPTVYPEAEFEEKRGGGGFVDRVLAGEKVMVVGGRAWD